MREQGDEDARAADHRSPRIYTPTDALAVGSTIDLNQEHTRYLGQVLRLKAGANVRVFNGKHGELEGEFAPIIKKTRVIGAQLHLKRTIRDQGTAGKMDVWLAFAPIKPKRLKLLLEKATELGVDTLCPVVTENTAVARPESQAEKMESQLIEASEQSERLTPPTMLKCASSLDQLLSEWPKDRILYVCQERSKSINIMEELLETKPPSSGFLIGPEGGFSSKEILLLEDLEFVRFISLGELVLRAETAVFYALACWNAYKNTYACNVI